MWTRLQGAGIDVPEWGDIDRGQRPGFHPDDEFSRFTSIGWLAFASTPEEAFFNCDLSQTDQALARSQRGPMASIPFFTAPVSVATRFDPQCFRMLLLRRLWCQLPLSSATCRCGQPLDTRGHHRGACANAGVLGRRGFPLESCAARICREAGARVPKHPGTGSGLPASEKGGQPSLGSGGRRPPTFPWRSVGHRHHNGQCCPSR